MEQYKIAKQDDRGYFMGLTKVHGGIHLCVAAEGEECRVLFFEPGESEPVQTLTFPKEFRRGDVWSMTVLLEDFSNLEYCFEIDGKTFADPYARRITGREDWGDLEGAFDQLKSPVEFPEFDWGDDKLPQIPYEDSIVYRIHGRGFTKHASSKVMNKGTFRAIQDKIPYLKELGITTVELMPVNEFSEVVIPDYVPGNPYGVEKPMGKLNYWGYVPGYYFAPKSSYSSGKEKDPVKELKTLVKMLHKEGLELIMELYFTGKESPSFVLDVIRFWVDEYHVDGVHLSGFPSLNIIAQDPFLSRIKLWSVCWDNEPKANRKHLGEYNDGFMVDMRRVLKGDEDQINILINRTRRNPADFGVINYMANTNGFTMMDMVSYDTKHNERNGEENQDGNPYNFSWNCGTEGSTRRKKVVELRKKQLRNAFLLLFLSQGTPLLMAGDEFGNSQSGNNNAYCQDNGISWLNWNNLKKHGDLLDFVKAVISFRKAHPVFHMKEEPKNMDYLVCGIPDVSYHGVKPWCLQLENFRRQLGILYCGEYARKPDGTADDTFYVAYNMHWEPHHFDLPSLTKGKQWYVVFHTNEKDVNGMYEDGEQPLVEEKDYMVPPRTIVVFIGKEV